MKGVCAAVLLFAFTAAAADAPTPAPLVPVPVEQPAESETPAYARWYLWATLGSLTAATIGTFLFVGFFVLPGFAPKPVNSGAPR